MMASVAQIASDAHYMTVDEFFVAHPDITVSTARSTLTELLEESLCNDDILSRLVLSNRFLDWGADPTVVDREKSNVLHTVAQRLRDPVAEAPLFRGLLVLGADPNQQSPRYGLPLEILMNSVPFNEQDLAPMYDVLFERPDLDFFIIDRGGDSLWDKVWRVSYNSPGLVGRMVRYIVEHTGAPPPAPQFRKHQPDKSWLRFDDGDVVEQGADGYWFVARKAEYEVDVVRWDPVAGWHVARKPEADGAVVEQCPDGIWRVTKPAENASE